MLILLERLKLSTDYYDIAYEEHLNDLALTDLREKAVDEYKLECLKRHYLQNPDSIVKAKLSVDRARALLKAGYATPSFVFCYTSTELLLKNLILKPLFYGAMIDDDIAEFIIDDVLKTRPDLAKNLAIIKFFVMRFCEIDINDYRKQDIWDKVGAARVKRNGIIHDGAQCTKPEAEALIKTATYVYDICESIVLGIGLKIDKKTWKITT